MNILSPLQLHQIMEIVEQFYPELLGENLTKPEREKLSEIVELIEVSASDTLYYYFKEKRGKA